MAREKSWREIDRMRDRGGRRGPRSTLERALEDPRLKQKYLEEAERLFMGPKGRPGHDRALEAIHAAYGSPAFPAKVKEYCEKYDFPEDWRTLILLLDLEGEPELVVRAMEALAEMAPEMKPTERKGFLSKLRLLALSSREPEVQELAEELLEELF